jgi:putative transposase
MNKLELRSNQPSSPKYKKVHNEHLAVPNTLNREFNVERPNQVWFGDVMYIWIGKRWAYLAIVLDLFSRKPIFRAYSLSPDSQLTSKALINAYESRCKPKGVLFHSDQGMHYTSQKFRQTLWRCQIMQSMSRRGNCWDNAPMERFLEVLRQCGCPKLAINIL